ncbi:hypothetical protein [Alistipes putredinis]
MQQRNREFVPTVRCVARTSKKTNKILYVAMILVGLTSMELVARHLVRKK